MTFSAVSVTKTRLFLFKTSVTALVSCVLITLSACQSSQDYYTTASQNKAELAALRLPNEFEITRVNGKEYDTPLVRNESQHFFFPVGTDQIEFRYKKYWELSGDNHEIVKSLPFVLELTLQSGHTYKIDYSAPKELIASREFAKKPQIRIAEENGALVPYKEIAQASEPPAETEKNATDMLHYWWKKASPEQRKAFDEWLKASH